MINLIKDWFKKSDTDVFKSVSKNESVQKFELSYKKILIGYLEVIDDKWSFYYSDEFKNNSDFHYISGFPDLDKVYYSDTLWPFFKIRIPGLGQPHIKHTIVNEKIEINDEFALLKRFGKKSISNPYLLNPVSL